MDGSLRRVREDMEYLGGSLRRVGEDMRIFGWQFKARREGYADIWVAV